MRELIKIVIDNFYQLAINDVLIGYHFDKFKDPRTLELHLERITTFWEMQLAGTQSKPLEGKGFQLLFTHLELRLKPGELGRWIHLFHHTLSDLQAHFKNEASEEECNRIEQFIIIWKQKISFFEERFKAHPMMFNRQ